MPNPDNQNPPEQQKSREKRLIQYVQVACTSSISNLEKWVKAIKAFSSQDGHLPIDGTRLQEYQTAIDAIRNYRNTLIEKIKKVYEEK